MVQVRVAGVALDAAQQHVILLKPLEDLPGEGRLLPIWIGAQEATSILVAVEGAPVPRPLAHDLMREILDTLGATVDRVEVTRIDEGTYYADVVLDTPSALAWSMPGRRMPWRWLRGPERRSSSPTGCWPRRA